MSIGLRITAAQHARLFEHLFPGDGREAVAFILCGRRATGSKQWLLGRRIALVPQEQCKHHYHGVTWSTNTLWPLVEEAAERDFAVVKVHSHPNGFPEFSDQDDTSDRDLFETIHGIVEGRYPHGSAVMLPGGRMFGRAIQPGGDPSAFDMISVVGDELQFWAAAADGIPPGFTRSHAQAFGAGTVGHLQKLRVAVVGCSGTGSPVAEQLARLGTGELVLIDPDGVEERNLNRIYGATRADAEVRRTKVEVLARNIRAMGLGTKVLPVAKSLFDPEVVRLVGSCDVAFGCMDRVEGRHLLNRLATFYLVPYFDVGVRIEADGSGGVDYVGGVVHYLQPGGSSLLSRGVYSLDEVHAESLQRTDPAAYTTQVRARYIVGVTEERPAVISVNTQIAAQAVNELLARVHPFREDENRLFAVHRTILSRGEIYREPEGEPCGLLLRYIGRGDMQPLLEMPALSESSGPC